MRHRLAAPILVALSVLPLALIRARGTDLPALTFGKIIVGPPTTPESLSGKVVMVEFWGTK